MPFASLRRQLTELLAPPASAGTGLPPDLAYVGDGLWTRQRGSFLDDPLFKRAYAAGKTTGSWWDHDLEWRAHVVCWAASRGAALDGDFVECGVHRGGFSRMLADYVDLAAMSDQRLWLIDTYRGVPERFRRDDISNVYGEYHREVLANFAAFPNAVVVRGEIPDILPEVVPDRVCHLSIDLNCVEPSIAAAEHFWPLMTRGAAMVFDDYGFVLFRDQQMAFDDFARRHAVPLLSLPTGQGLVIKP